MSRKNLATIGSIFLAFVLGWVLKPDPASSDPTGNDTGSTRNGSKSSRPTDSGAEPRISSLARGQDLLTLGSRRSLSGADILALGYRFRSNQDRVEHRLAFARLLEGMTPENARLIREQIAHLPATDPEFREFHHAWGRIAGEAAVMAALETGDSDMAPTLAGWASADPAAAMEWFENIGSEVTDEQKPEALIKSMVFGLSIKDPDLASDFIFRTAASLGSKAEELLGIVTHTYLQHHDAADAAAWIEDFPEGALRSSAMGRIANEYADLDPAAAAAWATAFVHDEGGGQLIHSITNQWATKDGAATVAWLDSIGDNPGRGGAYNVAFARWAEQDPVAASKQLAAMPESPDRDMGIFGFVSKHRWEDAPSTIAWADAISSEPARLQAITRAGQAWFSSDPAAAAAWAKSSGLPDHLQRIITNTTWTTGK